MKVYREENTTLVLKKKMNNTFPVDFPKVKSTQYYIAHDKCSKLQLRAMGMAQHMFVIQYLPRKLDCSFYLD